MDVGVDAWLNDVGDSEYRVDGVADRAYSGVGGGRSFVVNRGPS
jgi:hypothetical protein